MPTVLILTPVKNSAHDCAGYFSRLHGLTYPADLISVGVLESDSNDDTYEMFRAACERSASHFRHTNIWKKDFGYKIPLGRQRWDPIIQFKRRGTLARSRNHLLFHALDDEDWVLWLDVDVIEFPADIIEKLLSYKRDILQPHCVKSYGGPTYDRNAWRDQGRVAVHDMREEGEIAEIDTVGGTMLLIRADCHRDGLIFPPYLYGRRNPKIRTREDILMPDHEGEIETEGLGIMASDMNLVCWCLPNLEVIHANR
jgi:glycosyltransferase involved in cell wall biosynthesis